MRYPDGVEVTAPLSARYDEVLISAQLRATLKGFPTCASCCRSGAAPGED